MASFLAKNVFLINATLLILVLSNTYDGSVHDKRIANQTPYCLPKDSTLLQDLGFLAFALDGMTSSTPFKKPRGGTFTDAQRAFSQELTRRRVRIEHVNSRVKRCRIVKGTIRLFKLGVRDIVVEVGCALHNFRVQLIPWTPMN